MDSQWTIVPSRSALLHMRFAFSLFLLPVFFFACSQAPQVVPINAILTFIIWHFLVYPASNGYNSYFDKDEGSVALLENPPEVDKSLYYFSLCLDAAALLLAAFVSWSLLVAVLLYGVFSKLYSHPSVRLKKHPIASFLIVFIFQGACVYWSSYAAVSGLDLLAGWNSSFLIAGLICSGLIGATYPLTQVYQHEEDKKRGDKTLSLVLGVRGTFVFSAGMFVVSGILQWWYWNNIGKINHFWLFILFAIPVITYFGFWLFKVYKDSSQADFKNMSRMTILSGGMMAAYFGLLNFI